MSNKFIYKCSFFESKRHRISHTDMYYEKAEHTEWVFELEDWVSGLVRVEYIMVGDYTNYYKSAVENSVKMEKKKMEAQLERQRWVDEYNNSLPQKKWYDNEFEEDMSIAIGGIYDSEYDEYVFANVASMRIKMLRDTELTMDTMVRGIRCRKCGMVVEPHTVDEHLDINHCIHNCEGGHKRK